MAEFRVHHLVSQLLECTGADPKLAGQCVELIGSASADQFNHIGVVTAKATVMRRASKNAHEFIRRYDQIRKTQSKELDPMVYILSKVIESPDLQEFVQKAPPNPTTGANPAPTSSRPLTAPGSRMTDEEVQKLRNDLAAATTGFRRAGGLVSSGHGGEVRGVPKDSASGMAPPTWLFDRPFMTSDFPRIDNSASTANPIASLSVDMQEVAIVDDLLYIMSGVEGKYIKAVVKGEADEGWAQKLGIDEQLDPSLRDLASRLLPLGEQYSTVARFLDCKDGYAAGMVRQAITAAMRDLVKEYLIVVAQLETQFRKGALSLQRLWFYAQPCMRTIEILASIVDEIIRGRLRGGALLSVLHAHAMNQLSDSKAQELCLHLAQAASEPYFTILEQWIYKGVIDDPYDEFLVKEEKGLHRDAAQKMYNDIYWERRYTVVTERCPAFLEPMTDKILRTGKYLNVIREGGGDPQFPEAVALQYQLRERVFINVIADAYSYASKSLLHLLNTDMKLLQQLTSLKNYFCMQLGDFFAHFLDIAETELSKIVRDIEPSRVEALLGLALRTSTAATDPFKDNLKFGLVPHNLVTELFRIMNITHDYKGNDRGFVSPDTFTLEGPDSMAGSTLTGLEAFTFDFEVQWPVSLVISRKSIKRYQLIFRHLFRCRHVELTLSRTWLDDQFFKDVPHDSASPRAAAFALRQRMLNFVQSFQYYTMYEVIEPNWHIMAEKLRGASTLDDVLEIHNTFLDTCLKECMLTNPSTIKTISKLLSVCSIFTTGMKNLSGDQNQAKFELSINQFDHKFSTLMRELMASLTEFAASASEQHMSNMVARLDFNGYYSMQMRNSSLKGT